MVKSLRLTWLRRFYSGEDAGWKSYLRLLLKSYGGDFLFHCDYDPKDYDIANKVYSELVSKGAKTLQNKFTVLDSVSLSKIYLLSRNVCFETYLRDLQFKVLNFITCTNVLLKRMGIVDSDMCTFC